MKRIPIFAACIMLLSASVSWSQSGLALQGSRHDSSLPIEVTANALTFDQETQIVLFEGDAKAIQGDIVLQADVLEVIYNEDTGEVAEVSGTGSVVYDNGAERAEADTMAYSSDTNLLVLEGSVTMTQGQTVLSANRMVLNVTSNAAELTGNVRTRFLPRN